MNKSNQTKPESRVSALMKATGGGENEPWIPTPAKQTAAMKDQYFQTITRVIMFLNERSYGKLNPFAIDDRGRPISIRQLAKELKIDQAHLWRTWDRGKKAGLWRTDAEGRLYPIANVTPGTLVPEDDEKCCQEDTGDPTRVHSALTKSELNLINNLPPDKKRVLVRDLENDLEAFKKDHALLIALLRLRHTRKKDSRFRDHGLELNHNGHQRRPEAAEQALPLLDELGALAAEAETADDMCVHTKNPSVHSAEALSVQEGRTRARSLDLRRESIASSSSAFSPSSNPPEKAQPAKADEEDRQLYKNLKAQYPKDHFDEAKAKPAFEAKAKEEKRRILERLTLYKSSPRWTDTPQYIPLASNWLKTYQADPPPKLASPTKTERRGPAPAEDVIRIMQDWRKT